MLWDINQASCRSKCILNANSDVFFLILTHFPRRILYCKILFNINILKIYIKDGQST